MGQGRILIIDDDPDITEAMSVVLENKGYEVRSAADGSEGMNRIQESRAQYKDIPILMLTAVKDKTGLDFKANAGDQAWLPVEAFLDKPVKPDVLLEKVQSLLPRR